MPFSEIAPRVGVHVTRIYQWRDGKSHPGGVHLARLILVSERAITVESVAAPMPRVRAKKSA